MVTTRRSWLAVLIDKVPGKNLFGLYRFMPLFFVSGAALEYLMIHWEAGEGKTNFYKTYKRRLAREMAMQQLQQESARDAPAPAP